MPGSSREVIRASTYLFLGTCVHPVFLTKCEGLWSHFWASWFFCLAVSWRKSCLFHLPEAFLLSRDGTAERLPISLPLVNGSAITTIFKSSPPPLHSHIPLWQLLLLFFRYVPAFFFCHSHPMCLSSLLLSLSISSLCLFLSAFIYLLSFPTFGEAFKSLLSSIEASSLLPKDKIFIFKCWILFLYLLKMVSEITKRCNFYPFTVTFNVLEHPGNKLSLVITYVTHFFVCHCLLKLISQKKCSVFTSKHKLLCPEDAVNVKR